MNTLARVRDALTGGRRRPDEPPLLRPPLPFLGHAPELGRDLLTLLRRCQRQHGDVFTLLIAGRRTTFVLDPFSFPLVLRHRDDLDFHEIAAEYGRRAFGYTLVRDPSAAEEIQHLSNRQLLGPPQRTLTARSEASLRRAFERLALVNERQDDLFSFVARVVFTATAETFFGEGADLRLRLDDFLTLDRYFPLLVGGVPARLLPGVGAARERLAAALARVAPDASAFILERDALLSRETAPRSQARHQLAVLWAALANTIPAAFWTLCHLLAEPAAAAAVRAEVRAHGLDDLRALPRLQSSVSEALRLCSQSLITRGVRRDLRLTLDGGQEIALRAGDWVALPVGVLHRDPEIYEDPDRFRFDRFVSDGGARSFSKRGRKVPLPLLPYGGGVSMCPGRSTANNEIMQFVALALTKLDIELGASRPPPLDLRRGGLGILSPKTQVPCRVRRAAPGRSAA